MLALLLGTLALWYWTLSILRGNSCDFQVGALYWAAITFSRTLGSALGELMAQFIWGLAMTAEALIFAAGLAVLAAAYFGLTCRGCFYLGGVHSYTVPLARPSAIFSISPSKTVALR